MRFLLPLSMALAIAFATGPQALSAALLMWAACEMSEYLWKKERP